MRRRQPRSSLFEDGAPRLTWRRLGPCFWRVWYFEWFWLLAGLPEPAQTLVFSGRNLRLVRRGAIVGVVRRTLLLGVVGLAGLAAAVVPALADQPPIAATSQGGNLFTPSTETITAGQTVTWQHTAGDGGHNVHFVGEPTGFSDRPDGQASTGQWSYSRRFDAPGTYTFYCDPHARVNPDGTASGMSGTITVTAGTPPPLPPPPNANVPLPPVDATPNPPPAPSSPTKRKHSRKHLRHKGKHKKKAKRVHRTSSTPR